MFLRRALFVLIFTLAGCRASPSVPRVALIAPFEGRYREVGYDALYAARLALTESGQHVNLVALDDGGTLESAIARAKALQGDPLTIVTILIGYHAVDSATQTALGDIPALIVGEWSSRHASPISFVLTNPFNPVRLGYYLPFEITNAPDMSTSSIGSDVLTLSSFLLLNDNPNDIRIMSSGSLPDESFVHRYQMSDPFAPPPSLRSTLMYDAARIAIEAARSGNRVAALQAITETDYDGLNGRIRFESGYWRDAPLYAYEYIDGILQPSTDD